MKLPKKDFEVSVSLQIVKSRSSGSTIYEKGTNTKVTISDAFVSQELESKLKEVFAANGEKNATKGGGGGGVENVGKRMATKFLAQVEIKQTDTDNGGKKQQAAGAGNGNEPTDKKEVRD